MKIVICSSQAQDSIWTTRLYTVSDDNKTVWLNKNEMQKRFYTARALFPLRHCLSLSDVRALNLMCGKNHASTKIALWKIFNKLKNREEKNLTHTLLLLDTQQQQQPIHFILLLFFIALARNISIFQYNFRTFKEQSCQICLSSSPIKFYRVLK